MKTFEEIVELLEEVGIPSYKTNSDIYYSYNKGPIIVSLGESKILISKGDNSFYVVCFNNKNEPEKTKRIRDNKIDSFILNSIIQGKFKE